MAKLRFKKKKSAHQVFFDSFFGKLVYYLFSIIISALMFVVVETAFKVILAAFENTFFK